jgi:hypothetical protein
MQLIAWTCRQGDSLFIKILSLVLQEFFTAFKKGSCYGAMKLREIIPTMPYFVIWVISIFNFRCFNERDSANANIQKNSLCRSVLFAALFCFGNGC